MANEPHNYHQRTRADWAIMALAAAADGKLTPVQIQKTLFLLSQEAKDKLGSDFYEFIPYNYGPFSKEIYNDLEEFSAGKLVDAQRKSARDWPTYIITMEGLEHGVQLLSSLEPSLKDYLGSVVAWTKSLKFSELVSAIYEHYPSYKANSIFVKQ